MKKMHNNNIYKKYLNKQKKKNNETKKTYGFLSLKNMVKTKWF